ncbi:hypothetical protein RDABS01_036730 [Bienertia sinuspersici]
MVVIRLGEAYPFSFENLVNCNSVLWNPKMSPVFIHLLSSSSSLRGQCRISCIHKEVSQVPSSGNGVGTPSEHLVGVGEGEGERGRGVVKADRELMDIHELEAPVVEGMELDEFPENWRRSKLAWLCKELGCQKTPTIIRLLNAQKKWMRHQDASFVVRHFLRIRLYHPAFSVYRWMIQQHWYRFDFGLATKLADYLGRERKFARCREVFDHIINQGRVPCESTFHILIVAYLSAQPLLDDYLKEACDIYNRMLHLGGYRPRLSLHNALFRAIANRPASSVKHYLKQAEFIFHNLVTSGFLIHDDIYAALLWLHSHQDIIDKDRILFLRKEMHLRGIPESEDTLLSILRAFSKEGDVYEAEGIWRKLLHSDAGIPSQAYVYKMDVYAKVGDSLKSLDVFRELQEQQGSKNIVAFQKIIQIVCNAQQVELAESLVKELVGSGLKSLTPSYVDLLNMYYNLSLHDKVESTFMECLAKCRPNRTVYGIYLDSLVKSHNIEKAEIIFNQMLDKEDIGISSRSCNTLLTGYLSCDDSLKAEKLHRFMRKKNYEVEPSLKEKLDHVSRSDRKVVERSVALRLTPEQREILVGLLLGGLKIEYAVDKKQYFVCFEFKDNSTVHSILKRHIYNKFHEWLQNSNGLTDGSDDIPSKFLTVAHSCFGLYGHQFWTNGRQSIPKLLHRWLSPRVLAYWFMFGGYTTPTGDVLLKMKGSKGDLERVFKALKSMTLEFKIKQKGKAFWLGFMGSHATCFWRIIEPYLLDDMQVILRAGDQTQSSEKLMSEKSSIWLSYSNSQDSRER